VWKWREPHEVISSWTLRESGHRDPLLQEEWTGLQRAWVWSLGLEVNRSMAPQLVLEWRGQLVTFYHADRYRGRRPKE
jgi:hypothetical protein